METTSAPKTTSYLASSVAQQKGHIALNGLIPLPVRFSMYRIANNPQSNLSKIKKVTIHIKFAHLTTKHKKVVDGHMKKGKWKENNTLLTVAGTHSG